MAEPVLSVRNLNVRFRTGDGILHAVKGIDLDVAPGETVAIVGESGSGKSQTMMSVMGPWPRTVGRKVPSSTAARSSWVSRPTSSTAIAAPKLTMIFQEPMTSLDPLYRVGDQLALPLTTHGGLSRAAAASGPSSCSRSCGSRSGAAPRLLSARAFGRPAPARHDRHGARQQSGRAHRRRTDDGPRRDGPGPILELLADLQKRLEMSIVFITHDLGIVRRFADRTYVMKSGEVVERSDERPLRAPKHPSPA